MVDYLLAKLELIIRARRSLAIELIIPLMRVFPSTFVLISFSYQFYLMCESSRGALFYIAAHYHIGSEKNKTFKNSPRLIEKSMVSCLDTLYEY